MSYIVLLPRIHTCVQYHVASPRHVISGAQEFEGSLQNVPPGSDFQLSVNHTFTQQGEQSLNKLCRFTAKAKQGFQRDRFLAHLAMMDGSGSRPIFLPTK